jgi:adenylate cyclase class 2
MEIEVKAKVASLDAVEGKLKSMKARLEARVEQRDVCYITDRGRKTRGPGDFIVRIRRQGKDSYLAYKELTEVTGAWKEYESSVGDADAVQKIIEGTGLEKLYELVKKRTRYFVDGFEVCLDRVEGLGDYVEVALEPEGDVDKSEKSALRKRIMDFMKGLGVSEESLEPRGYGEIIGEKLGYKFEGMN